MTMPALKSEGRRAKGSLKSVSSNEKSGPPILSIEALCDALSAQSVTLTVHKVRGESVRILASPAQSVTPEMADAIRLRKALLVSALSGMGPITPFPCSFCGLDFVSIRGDRCRTCAHNAAKPLRFSVETSEERLFLLTLEKREKFHANPA